MNMENIPIYKLCKSFACKLIITNIFFLYNKTN